MITHTNYHEDIKRLWSRIWNWPASPKCFPLELDYPWQLLLLLSQVDKITWPKSLLSYSWDYFSPGAKTLKKQFHSFTRQPVGWDYFWKLATKTDGTAFDPLPHLWKIMLHFFPKKPQNRNIMFWVKDDPPSSLPLWNFSENSSV